jgi:hypothetical protein
MYVLTQSGFFFMEYACVWRPCCGFVFPQWTLAPVFVAPGTNTETHPAYKKKSNSNLREEVVSLLLLQSVLTGS